MSKCGINRYKAGGRCGAFETSAKGVDTSQVGTSFAAILAQREAQDATMRAPPVKQYATPALTQVVAGQALVKRNVSLPEAKQKDIDMILRGDFN
jgi:hypothetical protein